MELTISLFDRVHHLVQGPEGQTFVVDQGMALQHFFLWTFHNNYEAVSGWLTTDIDIGIVRTCNIQTKHEATT